MITFLASYSFLISLLSVLTGAFVFFTIVFKIPFWQVAGWPQSLLFTGLLFLNRAAGFIMEIKERRWYRALFSLWLMIIILGFLIDYLYRYEIVLAGTRDGVISSSVVDRGLLSRPGDFSLRFENNMLRLVSPSRIFNLQVKEGTQWRFNYIFFIKKGFSPRFLLKDKNGRELDTAFVMLLGKEDHFKSPALPHRFYVKKEKEGLGLRIMRGKLTLKRGIIKIGEEMEFEGLRITFAEITEWYQIRIINYPGNGFIILGSIILIIAAIALRIKRKADHGE